MARLNAVRASMLPLLLLVIPSSASAIHKSPLESTPCSTEVSPTATPYRRLSDTSNFDYQDSSEDNEGEDSGYHAKKKQVYSSSPTGRRGYPVPTPTPSNYYNNEDDIHSNGNSNWNSINWNGEGNVGCQCTINLYPTLITFPDVYTVHPEFTADFASIMSASCTEGPVEIQYVTAPPTSVLDTITLTAGTPAVAYSVELCYAGSDGNECAPTQPIYNMPMETVVVGNRNDWLPRNDCVTVTEQGNSMMWEPATKTIVCQLDAKATGFVPAEFNGMVNVNYLPPQGRATTTLCETASYTPYAPKYSNSTISAPPVSTPTPVVVPAPAPAPAAPQVPAPALPPPNTAMYNSMTKVLSSMPTKAHDSIVFSNGAGKLGAGAKFVSGVFAVLAVTMGIL